MPDRIYAKNQEYRIAERWNKKGVKARRVPLSGACAAIGKGDVDVDDGKILIDHKSTKAVKGKDQITLHREPLEKIQVDAGGGNLGAVTFSFFGSRQVYIILPLDAFIDLYKQARDKKG